MEHTMHEGWTLDADAPFPPGRYDYRSATGLIEASLDTTAFEFYLDVSPDAGSVEIEWVLSTIFFARGLELISDEECEPETLENGWVRRHAAPVLPMDDLMYDPLLPAVDERGEIKVSRLNALRGATGAAAFVVAAWTATHASPLMEVFAA